MLRLNSDKPFVILGKVLPFLYIGGILFGFGSLLLVLHEMGETGQLEGKPELYISKHYCLKEGLLWLTFPDNGNLCLSMSELQQSSYGYIKYEYKTWYGETKVVNNNSPKESSK